VREGEIVQAAEQVFGQKGFDGASMDEIALAAQFTKRTLYQYFPSKEELFYTAALRGFQALLASVEAASQDARTGIEKLRAGSRAYYRFSKEQPDAMRVIGEIGQVKKRTGTGSARLEELMRFDNEMFHWVARVIEAGKADGSVRGDLDAVKATFSIIFMMTGFFNQLALTGETFAAHFKLDAEEFSGYSMDLLFDSMGAK
jgi:AcrR family transcriptional regulator